MHHLLAETGEVYQGQFGQFTVTTPDRKGVLLYRAGLAIAAASFGLGTLLALWSEHLTTTLPIMTLLYGLFCLGLGVSLYYIHIYLVALHRALQVFWGIGCLASLIVAITSPQPLALAVYTHPLTLLGVGFTFAALTGIFFKEAFCFNRLETKALTLIVPILLLGHLFGWLPLSLERGLLGLWAILFLVFALRKVWQAIPPDLGDKSVFDYLKRRSQGQQEAPLSPS
ncbi:MAG: DUF2301 domain-containing membrane protein [Aphanocapsa sp. GSE-SYN-MK-11-07L]|jgi:uncharacterized integral membrane protein|nr:DUF2301 domain-containing membrane protein [Aphanocapsa sp. GSE-SYN-MK-11-07L]